MRFGTRAIEIDDNRAAWIGEASRPTPCPALSESISADVVIIGGGFTGVSTTWHLSQRHPELGIVLLKAKTLGNGASGRNGGQVLHWINGVEPRDPALTRRIFDVTNAGVDLAESLARAHAPLSFARRGSLVITTDSRRAEEAHTHAEELRGLGIPVEFLSSSELTIERATGGLLYPTAGRLNGFALLQAMRGALIRSGVRIYEGSPVQRIREGRTIQVSTPAGLVRGRAMVLATNGYSPSLGYFRRQILPLHSHVLATEPLSPEQWTRSRWGEWDSFSDDRDRVAYACRTPAGRVLFGGGSNAAYSYQMGGSPVFPYRSSHPAWNAMREQLLSYFPSLGDVRVEQCWSGTLALTLDRVCTMGVRGADRNVYYALGYSGHGVALALLAGRVLTDLYDGNHDDWRDLPFYQRRLLPMPPEPLRWLGYHAYTRLTGRSPRRIA